MTNDWMCLRCSGRAELYTLTDGRKRPYCKRDAPAGATVRQNVVDAPVTFYVVPPIYVSSAAPVSFPPQQATTGGKP